MRGICFGTEENEEGRRYSPAALLVSLVGCDPLWDFGRTQRSAPAGARRAESAPSAGRRFLWHKGAFSRQGTANDIRLCGDGGMRRAGVVTSCGGMGAPAGGGDGSTDRHGQSADWSCKDRGSGAQVGESEGAVCRASACSAANSCLACWRIFRSALVVSFVSSNLAKRSGRRAMVRL